MMIDHKKSTLTGLCVLQQAAVLRRKLADERVTELNTEIACRLRDGQHAGNGYAILLDETPHYVMDWRRWSRVKASLPEQFRPTRWIETLNFKSLMYLRDHEPEAFKTICTALDATPKTKVTVTPFKPTEPIIERIAHVN